MEKNTLIILLAFALAAQPFDFAEAQKKKSSAKKSQQSQSASDEVDSAGEDLEDELKKLETEEFNDLNVDEAAAPVLEEPSVVEDTPAKPVAKKPAPTPEPPPPEIIDEEPELSLEAEAEATPAPEPVAAPEPEPIEEPMPVVNTPPPPPPIVDDEPDAEFEARMARIYQRFYNNQLSDSEWLSIVGQRRTETYQVQSGDTLWGVSETLFGNGFFWPKIWQLNNDSITNPREVNRGDKITFSAGSFSQEPSVGIQQAAGSASSVVPDENSPEGPTSASIPAGRRYQPVLMKLPPSLPDTQSDRSEYDESGLAIVRQSSPDISEPYPITSYITETRPETSGRIVDIESGGLQASTYQKVFVRLPSANVGDIYTAYRVRPSQAGGYPVDLYGEMEILEQVGDGLYKALVISCFDNIDVGTFLMRGPIPEGEFSKKGRPSTAETQVVGGEVDSKREFFGLHAIVYLEGGTNKGVETGDLLTVIKNEKLRRTLSTKSTTPIGKIKVLYATAEFATGVVVEAADEIRPGDRTGTSSEE